MKKANAVVGMKVQIKDGAWLVGNDEVGDVLTVYNLTSSGMDCTKHGDVVEGAHFYTYEEVRKVKGHAYL